MKYTGLIKLSGHIIVTALMVALLTWAFYQGSLSVYTNIWLPTLIVLSILVLDVKSGIFYTLVVVVAFLLFFHVPRGITHCIPCLAKSAIRNE